MPDLIGRTEAQQFIQDHYIEYINILKEVIDFKATLIPELFGISSRQVSDIAILLYLGKHGLSMIDGIQILTAEGAIPSSILQLRSLYETQLYLSWILNDETDERAIHFYVWTLRQKRHWAEKLISNKKYAEALGRLAIDEAKIQKKQIDEILETHHKTVNTEFDSLKRIKGREPKWHALSKVENVREMAFKLKQEDVYDSLYGYLSRYVHGNATEHHMQLVEDEIILNPIRYSQDISLVLEISFATTFQIITSLCRRYSEEKFYEFALKFNTRWQKIITPIPGVKIRIVNIDNHNGIV